MPHQAVTCMQKHDGSAAGGSLFLAFLRPGQSCRSISVVQTQGEDYARDFQEKKDSSGHSPPKNRKFWQRVKKKSGTPPKRHIVTES